jgi:hypothetical protein
MTAWVPMLQATWLFDGIRQFLTILLGASAPSIGATAVASDSCLLIGQIIISRTASRHRETEVALPVAAPQFEL